MRIACGHQFRLPPTMCSRHRTLQVVERPSCASGSRYHTPLGSAHGEIVGKFGRLRWGKTHSNGQAPRAFRSTVWPAAAPARCGRGADDHRPWKTFRPRLCIQNRTRRVGRHRPNLLYSRNSSSSMELAAHSQEHAEFGVGSCKASASGSPRTRRQSTAR